MPEPPLRLLVSPEEPGPRIAERLVTLLEREAGIAVEIVAGRGVLDHVEALTHGEADLAVVENSLPFEPRLSAVAPLYKGVLHVLYRSEAEAGSFAEVLRGARIYAGPADGVARKLLGWLAHHERIGPDEYEIIESPFEEVDVYFSVGGILSDPSLRALRGYRLLGLGDADKSGAGSRVDALALRHPQLRPFVLPAGLYPELSHAAVLTVSVPSLLVARSDLPASTSYEIARVILEHATRLREISPLADPKMSDAAEMAGLSFPLHPGARRYLDRDKPSFAERYAEVIGLNLSGMIALVTALLAARRWRAQSRKDRLDDYYRRVLELRDALERAGSSSEVDQIAAQVRSVQGEAYALLIAEKVPADTAFVILQSLVTDVMREAAHRADRFAGP